MGGNVGKNNWNLLSQIEESLEKDGYKAWENAVAQGSLDKKGTSLAEQPRQ
jgi:hypothetical protein